MTNGDGLRTESVKGEVCRVPAAVAARFRRELEQLSHVPLTEITGARADEVAAAGRSEFDAFVDEIKERLTDANRGYAYVDLSTRELQGAAARAVAATAISAAIFRRLCKPITDSRNGTPFNIYKSSADRAADMRKAGIHFYKPDEKLGFHNDAIINKDSVSLAEYVGLLNLFIGYEEPGNFYWLPIKRWSGHMDFVRSLGEGAQGIVETTPIVYENDLDWSARSKAGSGTFAVRMFPRISSTVGVFVNGTVREIRDASGSLVLDASERIQRSLLENGYKVALPQTTGYLTILKNDVGVHSRDIFTGQVILKGATRVLLRMVSESATEVGVRVNGQELSGGLNPAQSG